VLKISLIENDDARRNRIYRCFRDEGVHVEPYQDFNEFEKWNSRSSVIVIDFSGLDVLSIVGRANSFPKWYPFVAFSEQITLSNVVKVMNAGVIDFMHYPTDFEHLRDHMVEWETKLRRLGPREDRRRASRAMIASLTPRELETLTRTSQGKSTKDIGEELGISARTVEIFRSNIFVKLKVRTSLESVRIFCESLNV